MRRDGSGPRRSRGYEGRAPGRGVRGGRAADGTATYALDRESVRGLGRVLAERRWTGSALEATYQMRDHFGGASKAAVETGLDKAADAAVGLALPAPASPRAQAPRTTSGATLTVVLPRADTKKKEQTETAH